MLGDYQPIAGTGAAFPMKMTEYLVPRSVSVEYTVEKARALAGWRFAPARRRDGRPSAVHFTVTIPIARDRCR
jgi:hypothetical protein